MDKEITTQEIYNEESFYKLYETFVGKGNDSVFLKDENYRHAIANKTMADFYGVEQKSILGKTDYELMSFENAEKCRETDNAALSGDAPVVSIEVLNNRVFEIRKYPVILENGKKGIAGFECDITDIRDQSKRLSNSSERNRIIAECMLKPFRDKQEQLDYALHEALKLTESEYGYIFLYNEDKKELTLNSWTIGVLEECRVKNQQIKYCLEKTGVWGEVVRQRKAIIVNDFDKPNPMKKGYPEGHVRILKFMSIPLFENDRIIALFGFANKNADYTQDDVNEITILMNGVWLAVQKRDEQKKTEALLEQTQSMFNNHDAVMLLIDPESGAICDANPSAFEFYGYSKEELLKMRIQDINMLGNEKVDTLLKKAYEQKQKYYTFPHRKKDGEIRYVDVYICPIKYGSRNLLYSIIFDVTERERAQNEINFLGYHDYLTGLYNRRYYEETLSKLDTKENLPICIIMSDVNGLKTTNEIYGHEAGDKLLKKTAGLLKSVCSEKCVISRIGGDEFGIIVPNCSEDEANKLVDDIRKACRGNYQQELPISLSIGYQIKNTCDQSIEEIVKNADNSMFKRKMYESSSLRNLSIELVMNALFAKSEREMEHSSRVSDIAEKTAYWLKMTETEAMEIRIAALLHDIGKIGVPENVLNKEGLLNTEERRSMERHPEIGWRILGSSSEYKDLANYILHHHERWDGKGYPNGLKDYNIPLQSRIIAVADAYDAMTNYRPYRKALSKKQTLAQMKKKAGTQFDPEIIEVFIKNMVLTGDKV